MADRRQAARLTGRFEGKRRALSRASFACPRPKDSHLDQNLQTTAESHRVEEVDARRVDQKRTIPLVADPKPLDGERAVPGKVQLPADDRSLCRCRLRQDGKRLRILLWVIQTRVSSARAQARRRDDGPGRALQTPCPLIRRSRRTSYRPITMSDVSGCVGLA